jgi:hypothetical protein
MLPFVSMLEPVAAKRGQTGGQTATRAQAKSKHPDRTTPIQDKMTPVQRKHGTLHGENPSRSRLLDEKVSSIVMAEPMFYADRSPARRLDDVITDLACAVDAVFIAVPERWQSFPTEDGRWLFTDYDVRLGRVYRMPDVAGFKTGDQVVVSRSGGEVEVDGERIVARSNAVPPLKKNGRYLLFVAYEPETKALYTRSGYAVFDVRGSRTYATWPLRTAESELSTDGVANAVMLSALSKLRCR